MKISTVGIESFRVFAGRFLGIFWSLMKFLGIEFALMRPVSANFGTFRN
jgi:hypothetical protein